nr:hypothetical protein [Arthrobacter yangruifuii]
MSSAIVSNGKNTPSGSDAHRVMAACRHSDDVAPRRNLLDAGRSVSRGEHKSVCVEGDGM